MLTLGVSRTPRGTTVVDPPVPYRDGGGWNAAAFGASASAISEDGFITFSSSSVPTAASFRIQLPVRTDDLSGSQSLHVLTTFKLGEASTDESAWIGLQLGWDTDGDATWVGRNSTSGYVLRYRRTGCGDFVRVTDGFPTSIASFSGWPSLCENDTVKLLLDVTTTSMTVTLLEKNGSVQSVSPFTVVDSALAKGGLMRIVGSGTVPGVGRTTITY
jgi:hypothetical protein